MRSGERQDNLSLKAKQLNPFELKTMITKLLGKINSVADVKNCLDEIDLLDAQEDKNILKKLLLKELSCAKPDKIPVICFLAEHFIPKKELTDGYWEMLNNKKLPPDVKITILNILRETDSSFEDCTQYLEDEEEILDENTRQLLNNAVINPEVQIDFMDFLHSIKNEDKIILLNSFAQDFSEDALANILIPVFEAYPDSPAGREALKLLAKTKSQLALRSLNNMVKITRGELNQAVRKSLAELKMSGIRTDNTKEFYSKILANTKPDKFYVTYPDGHGDMAMIFTRITEEGRVRFVSIVINTETGIKDCFGFFDISQFECDKILERFLRDERVASICPHDFCTILYSAEMTTAYESSDGNLPYEYVCWKNLLADIDYEQEEFYDVVNEKVKPAEITDDIFEKLNEMKVSKRWFLDADYSDEFQNLLKDLKSDKNLDELIEKHMHKVFYDEEEQAWYNRLMISAFIKYSIGKADEAAEIYGLAKSSQMFDKFMKEILKRSIYEYFMTIKYNKDLNVLNFTSEEISDKINYIETNWVSADV